jgi:hypothetical protein
LQGNLTTEEDGRQNYGKVNFVAINGVDFKRYEQGGVYIHALNDIGGNVSHVKVYLSYFLL